MSPALEALLRDGDVEPLAGGRNDTMRVTTADGARLVVKRYREDGSAIANREVELYRRLQGCAAVRRLISGSPPAGDDPGHLVTEYLDGETLRARLDGDGLADPPAAIAQVVAYVRECARVPTGGFGNLDADLRGTAPSWAGFLDEYLCGLSARIAALPAEPATPLRASHRALRVELAKIAAELDAVSPVMVPVDLNLENLLVTEGERIVALDLEASWGADALLAFGEWAAHTWGTAAYSHFAAAWGPLDERERRRVRFYALLATLDIQLFVAEQAPDALADACPWGNPIPFAALAAAHRAALAAPATCAPEVLLERNPRLGADWAIKGAGGRPVPVAETLARLRDAGRHAGITRVADVSDLDATGIPVFQAVRPDAETDDATFTVFAGKGATREESKVAAIAEAIERFCAERRNYPDANVVTGSLAALRDRGAVSPRAFNLASDAPYRDDDVLEWVPARDLVSGEPLLVPACTVFYPYLRPSPLRYFTTGLAAGNSLVEALGHGLGEAIERDAAALNRILRDRPAVALETIDSEAANAVIERLVASGLRVIVRWITPPDLPVPAFSVICEDPDLRDPMYVSGGYGAHPDKETALLSALNEAAASRVGTISGAREDLTKYAGKNRLDYAEFRRRYAYWFDEDSARVDYRDLTGVRLPTVLDELAHMVAAVRGAGFERVVTVDLSREELILPVVKVLVPGIERYSFRMRCVGRRARSAYRAQRGRDLPLAPL